MVVIRYSCWKRGNDYEREKREYTVYSLKPRLHSYAITPHTHTKHTHDSSIVKILLHLTSINLETINCAHQLEKLLNHSQTHTHLRWPDPLRPLARWSQAAVWPAYCWLVVAWHAGKVGWVQASGVCACVRTEAVDIRKDANTDSVNTCRRKQGGHARDCHGRPTTALLLLVNIR